MNLAVIEAQNGPPLSIRTSSDGGLSWSAKSLPATVYAAAQAGVHRSTDWGITLSLTDWPLTHTTAVAVDPKDSLTIFVGTTTGLWVTQDGGSTWARATVPSAGYPSTIAVDPVDSRIVLVGLNVGPWRDGGIFRSTNGGVSFTYRSKQRPFEHCVALRVRV